MNSFVTVRQLYCIFSLDRLAAAVTVGRNRQDQQCRGSLHPEAVPW